MTAIDERRHPACKGSRLDVRALAVFFAVAYALSWSWAFPLVAAHLVVLRGRVGPPITRRCSDRRSRRFISGTQAATGMLAAVVSTLVMIQGVVLIVLKCGPGGAGGPPCWRPRSAGQWKGSYPYPFIAQHDDGTRGEVLGNLLMVGLDDG